ncbi:hypothetical protein [Bordetella ansorpii]|uniref:hypothetical protein n=1 Tax=Bordetella ansorpii TaxID=288768 RepID=UPI0008333BFA|nr:hypothetical protein [Bordetella ansorpii]
MRGRLNATIESQNRRGAPQRCPSFTLTASFSSPPRREQSLARSRFDRPTAHVQRFVRLLKQSVHESGRAA